MTWILEMVGASLAAAAGVSAYRTFRRRAKAPPAFDEQRALSLMSDMSTSIADSVRNPLSSLKGHAQLLCQMDSSPALRERVEKIIFDAERVESVVRDLLGLWKLKSWKPCETDLACLLRAWARAAGSDPIRVDVAEAPAGWVMDPGRVLVVLDLLLRTIRSRCGRSASVEVVARRNGRFLTVLLGSLDVVESAGAPSAALARTPNFACHYAIADLVACQHGGSVSVSESADGAVLFRLNLGRL